MLTIVCLGALGISVRIMSSFSSEAARLRPKLAKINGALAVLRERSAARKPNIVELQEATSPLRDEEKMLREYFEKLTQIDLEEMRKEDEQQREKEGKSIRHRG